VGFIESSLSNFESWNYVAGFACGAKNNFSNERRYKFKGGFTRTGEDYHELAHPRQELI
jgi:hypothetical protein